MKKTYRTPTFVQRDKLTRIAALVAPASEIVETNGSSTEN